MARGGKRKGPPYLDEPDSKYVVIIDPWGMVNAQERKQMDVHRVGTWMRFMLREQGKGIDILVEVVYMRSTQNEVIVQLPYRTNIEPILGEHRWPEFLKSLRGPNGSRTASYIFEYNYRNNGDPANHNWSDHYPTSDLPPDAVAFPVKYPYPLAHYADATRWNHLRSLILPLPVSRQRTPTPPPEDQPAEIQAENQGVAVKPDPVEESQPQSSFIEKYDPYEEEEAARQLLQAGQPKQEPIESTIPPVVIKQEVVVKQEPGIDSISDSYQASNALLESLATLPQHRIAPKQGVVVKQEPDINSMSDSYQASDALLESLATLKGRQNRQELAVKSEFEGDGILHGHLSDYTASGALAQTIHQHVSQRPPTSTPLVKTEPDTVHISAPQSSSTVTRDPRHRPVNNAPKRPKNEEEDHAAGLVKKVKTERNW